MNEAGRPLGAASLYHRAAYDTATPVPTIWRDTAAPAPFFPPLTASTHATIAIIGAGITGLSAALHLARDHGLNAIVLDAAPLGWGASGRNGGFCVPGGAKRSGASIARRFGPEQAGRFFRLQHEAVARVETLLAAESIEAAPQPGGEMLFAHSPRAFRAFAARRDEERALHGHTLDLLTPDDLKARGLNAAFHGARHEPTGFGLHPLDYVHGLARAAARHGAAIHPQTPVLKWRREAGRHILETPAGQITTDKLIVAAGAYQPEALSPALAGRILPIQSNILVTRALTEAERTAQGWTSPIVASDSYALLHYFRLLPDGRFLFGGRGGLSAAPQAALKFRARLTSDFHRLFPAWREVEITHFWSGLVDLAADLLPHCAALDETTFHACAYHGSGVALGTEIGAQLAQLAAIGSAPDLPAFMTTPAPRFAIPALRKAALAAALAGYALSDSF